MKGLPVLPVLLAVLLGLLCGQPVRAGLVEPAPGIGDYALGPVMDLLEDDTASLAIEAAASPLYEDRYRRVGVERPGYGFTRSALWFRVTVDFSRAGGRQWYLVESHPILDEVSFHAPDGNGGWHSVDMGDTKPWRERIYAQREFIFPIDQELASGRQPVTFYVRVAGKGALNVDLRLVDAQGLVERSNAGSWAFGLFYGALLVMLLYNLMLWFSVSDRTQLFYITFLGGYTLLFLSLNGFGLQYLWPGLPAANGWFPQFSCIAMWGALQFARAFLDIRRDNPRTDRAYRWMTHAVILVFLLAMLLPRHLAYVLGTALPLFFGIVLLVTGLVRLRQGYAPARLFVAGWGFFLLGTMLLPLANFGVLPINNLTFYAAQSGGVLLVLMLSLAQGERMNLLKRENERIEQESHEKLARMFTQLQRLDADKLRFLHYLSHELNTPLNWVGVVRTLDGNASPQLRNAVDAVERGQRRMTDLVATVLGYFDLAGEEQAKLALAPVAPMWLVEELLRERAGDIAARKLSVAVRVPAELSLLANEKRLRRVLGFVIDNAIQFSNEGGAIEVEGSTESYGTRGVITVRDQGKGIAADHLAGIFEPFFMVGSHHREDGFGLSLPTARLLLRGMDGEIRARSDGPGHGAEFSLVLPLAMDNESRAVPLGRAPAGNP